MRSIKPTTIRLSDDDIKLVEEVKQRYGVTSLIAVIRIALRIAIDRPNVTNERDNPNDTGDPEQHKAK